MNSLNYLIRRFLWDEKFFVNYRAFIEDMISKEYPKQREGKSKGSQSTMS